MNEFNLETAVKEARERLHRSIGQLARQAKVRVLDNCDKVFSPQLVRYRGNRRVPTFTRATQWVYPFYDLEGVLRLKEPSKR